MPEAPVDGGWSVYVVRCRDGTLYTGIAVDVKRRMEAHRRGRGGAKYLRGRAPLELAGQWPVGTRSLASRVEFLVKRMSRAGKEALIGDPAAMTEVISRLRRRDE